MLSPASTISTPFASLIVCPVLGFITKVVTPSLKDILSSSPSTSAGGSVTSVGLTSSDITVGGTSPITGAGTYTLTLPSVNGDVGSFGSSIL